MNGKVETSIQYQLTNVKFIDEVYLNWDVLSKELDGGPAEMDKYFLSLWTQVKKAIIKDPNLIVTDKDRVVTENDFNVTFNKTNKDTSIFYFEFPSYEGTDGACAYVAIAVADEIPRYLTLECHKNPENGNRIFVVGEYYLDFDKEIVGHRAFGQFDNMVDVVKFSDVVEEIVDKEGK